MLRELRAHGLAHDVVLHRFPVRAQWARPLAAHLGRGHRGVGETYGLFVWRTRELLRLETMLRRRPVDAAQSDREFREVGEFAIRIANTVEPDDAILGGHISESGMKGPDPR